MSVIAPTPRQVSRLLTCTRGQCRFYSAPGDRSIPPAKTKYVPSSGVYPRDFVVGTAYVGVKASNTKYDDLAVVLSKRSCSGVAVYTRNRFQAAPVTFTKTMLRNRSTVKDTRGVIINSGCANAVTGSGGLEDAKRMSEETTKIMSDIYNIEPGATEHDKGTMVMSTGVIGQRLPIDKIIDKLSTLKKSLSDDHNGWLAAARAICTTDTFPKLISREFTLPSRPDITYRIAGMTKGAGMIAPNMATLLGVVCTDAPVPRQDLRDMLLKATGQSFNRITIDGDTSTNDTVALFANGAGGGEPITLKQQIGKELQAELDAFFIDLAKLVVRDGEGATKFVTIKVLNAPTPQTPSVEIAKGIANSALVKTALYGKDANWGRIACAVGYTWMTDNSSVAVIPNQTSISFIPADGSEELKLLVSGEPQQVDEVRAKEILEMEDLEIVVKLRDKESRHGATVWTCDFSHEYVTINGDYRT